MNYLKSTLIYNYLVYSTKLYNIFYKYTTKLVQTTKFDSLSDDKKIKSYLFRYYVIRLIRYFPYFWKYSNLLNKNSNLFHISKTYPNGSQNFIISHSNIIDTMNKLPTTKNNNTLNKAIYISFYINNTDGNKVCLKKYLDMYRDNTGEYDHNLENILLINNINISNNDNNIYVKTFYNSMMNTMTLPFEIYKKLHIGIFNDLDNLNKYVKSLENVEKSYVDYEQSQSLNYVDSDSSAEYTSGDDV